MSSLTSRMLRASKLDARLYEEVEADRGALAQAMGVVVLASVAAGIGSITQAGPRGILTATVGALAGWLVWAYLTYFIGTKILPERQTTSTPSELLKTIGFASSPGLIRIFGVIPGFAGFIFLVSSVWMLIAMVIAVRQALDYSSTVRAVGVVAIGWIVQMAILAVVFTITGGPGV